MIGQGDYAGNLAPPGQEGLPFIEGSRAYFSILENTSTVEFASPRRFIQLHRRLDIGAGKCDNFVAAVQVSEGEETRWGEDVRRNPTFAILNQIITQSAPGQEAGRHVGLESVYLDTGLYPTAAELQNHQSTLTSIEMDISLSDGAIDCFAFHGCSQLKVLTLIGWTRHVTR